MAENENPKEEQLKCERCDSDKPARKYDPRIARLPDKRIALCDECAAKDTAAIPTEDEGVGQPEPEKPDLTEQEKIVTPKSKAPKASENKAKDVETKPIDRVDIEKKIAAQEKDIDGLLGQRIKFQQQLGQVQDMIVAKKGAVAGLRDLLGDS